MKAQQEGLAVNQEEDLHQNPSMLALAFNLSQPIQYCFLQHRTWPSPPDPSTADCHLRFGPATSLFLELLVIALCSSPVAYWTPSDLRHSSFSVISFHFFILFMGFSRQEYWSGLPFPSPVDHVLSELSTMTRLSWVTLHGMAHSFMELDKAVVHVISFYSHSIMFSKFINIVIYII